MAADLSATFLSIKLSNKRKLSTFWKVGPSLPRRTTTIAENLTRLHQIFKLSHLRNHRKQAYLISQFGVHTQMSELEKSKTSISSDLLISPSRSKLSAGYQIWKHVTMRLEVRVAIKQMGLTIQYLFRGGIYLWACVIHCRNTTRVLEILIGSTEVLSMDMQQGNATKNSSISVIHSLGTSTLITLFLV